MFLLSGEKDVSFVRGEGCFFCQGRRMFLLSGEKDVLYFLL